MSVQVSSAHRAFSHPSSTTARRLSATSNSVSETAGFLPTGALRCNATLFVLVLPTRRGRN